MFIETSISASERRRFVCKRCHHGRSAEVSAMGHGMQLAMQEGGLSNDRARADLDRELDQTIATAKCTRCEQRNPGAAWQFWRPYVRNTISWIGIGVALSFWAALGTGEYVVTMFLIGVAFTSVVGMIVILGRGGLRWSSIDQRVEWLED
jgi:hypothetical protein